MGLLQGESEGIYITEEHAVQNEIRLACTQYAVLFRINVGAVRTPDGRYFETGVPKGFSDLFGFRRSDGRAVFIEVKAPKGRIRPEQETFILSMKKQGALAGIARCAEDAIKIINGGN